MLDTRQFFADYKADGHLWITLASSEYYPDILMDACLLYEPVLVLFGQLLRAAESSQRLFLTIADVSEGWMRLQLARVFRRYVSPNTPVEMLKKKSQALEIIEQFGQAFRPIQVVQAAYESRPIPDEALCSLLWEYKSRGQKGYDLTERLFDLLNSHLPDLTIRGPKRAGQDIRLGDVLEDYPNPTRPVDVVIYDIDQKRILAIGLVRYDGDRGGSQEDDRTGGYQNAADEILRYAQTKGLGLKVIFINDGPGLLLGSMWNDYAKLENSGQGKIIVATLRMIPERITYDWLRS
jgi:hypothetical protein